MHRHVYIDRYGGSQRIDMLPVYPADERFATQELLDRLRASGKRYWDCLQHEATPRIYEGTVVDVVQMEKEQNAERWGKSGMRPNATVYAQEQASSTKEYYRGRVVVDPVLYAKEFGELRGTSTWLDNKDIRIGSNMEKELRELIDINPRTAGNREIQDKHYQLMPRWIRGFAVGIRKWSKPSCGDEFRCLPCALADSSKVCFDVASLEHCKCAAYQQLRGLLTPWSN